MDIGQQISGQVKQVGEAVGPDVLKGLGQAVSGVATRATETLVTGGMAPVHDAAGQSPQEQEVGSSGQLAQQIAQKDAQDLAKARQNLANFNARLAQAYQKVEQEATETKEVEAQEKQQEEAQKSAEKKARDEAILQAQRSGGGEGMSREVK